MGLKKVTGTRIQANLQDDVRKNVDPPSILLNHPARATWKLLALKLLGVTALTGEHHLAAVEQAAAALDESDEKNWTHDDAQLILQAVGAIAAPSHMTVARLKGEGTLLFRAVTPDTPGAEELVYPEGSNRPQISLLPALRREGINVPKGMAMEVPVKLVMEEDGLSLAAYFRRGTLREVSQGEGDEETGAKAK